MTSFFVAGTPIPKGSAKAFYNKKAARIVVMQDNRERQRPWASLITYTAQQKFTAVSTGPISLNLYFTMPRPKHHYGSGKNAATLKHSAPSHHTGTPDLDKLIRGILDALTGIVYKDDSQVCNLISYKKYGEVPGVLIEVEEI